MGYDTGLRAYTAKRIEKIEHADILVGIPCFNNERTIEVARRVRFNKIAKGFDRNVVFLHRTC